MTQGLARRQVVNDDELRSLAKIEQVQIRGPQGSVNAPRVPDLANSFESQIANSIGKFAIGALGDAINEEAENARIDGAMAAYQGKSFEDVEMQGDKYMLDGYRLVQAQQASSGLAIAQQHEIDDQLYEADPDMYRKQLAQRTTALLSGIKDPTMRDMAEKQLLKQMPRLLDTHMKKNLEFKEKQNFETLAGSIDILSQDPTAYEALVSFARGGEGTATAGLSISRRREAVSQGLVQAFQNNNPLAFSVLANDGIVKDLPVPMQQRIEGARKAYEQRMRTQYSADTFQAEQELLKKVEGGDLEPQQAVEAMADLWAEKYVRINKQDAGAIYHKAETGIRTDRLTRGNLIEAARLRGDKKAAANVIFQQLSGTESSGVAGALYVEGQGSQTIRASRKDTAAFLQSRAPGKATSHITGMSTQFQEGLRAMFEGAPANIQQGLSIFSGYRSPEHQARIVAKNMSRFGLDANAFRKDVATMGAAKAGAKWRASMVSSGMNRWYAPPGFSKHQSGKAADLSYNGKSLKHAPKAVKDWVHKNAGKFGLHFPLGNEPWHVEVKGSRGAHKKGAREFGGLVQLGSLRLKDYARASGTPVMTPREYAALPAAEQKRIGIWHITDLMDQIEKAGYNEYLGKQVGGVTVTTSGLVAAASLGGMGGLKRFITSDGADNPKDELGTSIGSYMKKHGAGEMQEFMSPQERLKYSQARVKQVREKIGLDTYEQIAPELEDRNDAFVKGDLSYDQWRQERNAIMDKAGYQKTTNDIRSEIAMHREFREQMRSKTDEQSAYAAGLQLLQSEQQFAEAVKAFQGGKVSAADMQHALQKFGKDRLAIQREHGIDFKASTELGEVERAVKMIETATKKRIEAQANTARIRQAENSGAADMLPKKLQEQAIKEKKQSIQAQAVDRIAEGKPQEDVQHAAAEEYLGYLAENSMVDPDTQRAIVGNLQRSWIKPDGTVDPAAAGAAEQMRKLWQANPALLAKYIPDKDLRRDTKLLFMRARGAPLDQVMGGIKRVGEESFSSERIKLDSDAAQKKVIELASDAAYSAPLMAIAPLSNGDGGLEKAGLLTAMFSGRADVSQYWDRSNAQIDRLTDPNGNAVMTLRHSITQRAQEIVRSKRNVLSADEAIEMARDEVMQEGAFVGTDFLHPRNGSIMDDMFGVNAKSVDVIDAPNAAIMEFLRDTKVQEQYPALSGFGYKADWSDFGTHLFGPTEGSTDVVDFRTGLIPDQQTGSYRLAIYPDAGQGTEADPIILTRAQLREIGMRWYKQRHNRN